MLSFVIVVLDADVQQVITSAELEKHVEYGHTPILLDKMLNEILDARAAADGTHNPEDND